MLLPPINRMRITISLVLAVVLIYFVSHTLDGGSVEEELKSCSADDPTCASPDSTEEHAKQKYYTPEHEKTSDTSSGERAEPKPVGGTSFDLDTVLKDSGKSYLVSLLSHLYEKYGQTLEKFIPIIEQYISKEDRINPIVKVFLQRTLDSAKSGDTSKIVDDLNNIYGLLPEGTVSTVLETLVLPRLQQYIPNIEKYIESNDKLNAIVKLTLKSVVDALKSKDLSEITKKLKKIYNLIPMSLLKSLLKKQGVPDDVVNLADKLPKSL